jgi:hypothetical protein
MLIIKNAKFECEIYSKVSPKAHRISDLPTSTVTATEEASPKEGFISY